MMTTGPDQTMFAPLEARIKLVLPEQYQDRYEDVQPVSMGSAGLKYDSDGQVAWDEIWGAFCDLAMAGGPPHKGKLLEPGSLVEIEGQLERYRAATDEICRGIRLVTDLVAEPAPVPGWVRVECESFGMASWLVRAIVMENVSARWEGTTIDLPAGPSYRVEKEIKNVITAIAKTCHYWSDHLWAKQQKDIGNLFTELAADWPLVQPGRTGDEPGLRSKVARAIERTTGLRASNHGYAGWLGLECPDVRSAIWMMRAMVVSNVLSRREETTLFVPLNVESDPGGERVVEVLGEVHDFAKARGVL